MNDQFDIIFRDRLIKNLKTLTWTVDILLSSSDVMKTHRS